LLRRGSPRHQSRQRRGTPHWAQQLRWSEPSAQRSTNYQFVLHFRDFIFRFHISHLSK
jgi:hypothetical protein